MVKGHSIESLLPIRSRRFLVKCTHTHHIFCLTWSFLCERRHQIQRLCYGCGLDSLSLPLSLQRRGKKRESGKGWEENATAHLLRRPHIFKWSVLCTSPFYTFYKAESYMAATVSIHLLGHQLQQPRIPPDRRIQRI